MYKFPMWKFWLFAAFAFGSFAILSGFDTAVHPTISATLAVAQLDDTEGSAIAMRTYERVFSDFPLGIWGAIGFVGLCLVFGTTLFRADIVQLFTRRRNDESIE